MIQKIIRVGNSVAVTIPKRVLAEKNLKVGQFAEIDVQPVQKTRKITLTPSFLKWVDDYIEKNRPALEELAHR